MLAEYTSVWTLSLFSLSLRVGRVYLRVDIVLVFPLSLCTLSIPSIRHCRSFPLSSCWPNIPPCGHCPWFTLSLHVGRVYLRVDIVLVSPLSSFWPSIPPCRYCPRFPCLFMYAEYTFLSTLSLFLPSFHVGRIYLRADIVLVFPLSSCWPNIPPCRHCPCFPPLFMLAECTPVWTLSLFPPSLRVGRVYLRVDIVLVFPLSLCTLSIPSCRHWPCFPLSSCRLRIPPHWVAYTGLVFPLSSCGLSIPLCGHCPCFPLSSCWLNILPSGYWLCFPSLFM